MSDEPGYFRIAAGTMPKRCHGCGAEVYQVMTAEGRKLVTAKFDQETKRPSNREHGVGVDHDLNCEDALKYRDRVKSSRMVPGNR